jgi:LacI family transcriptional regulator
VINSVGYFSEESAERVRRAARDLGYEINHVAKSLRMGATHTVAVMVGDLGNPFYSDFVKGIEEAAQGVEFSILVCTAPTDPEAAHRQVRMLLSKRVDGLIMWGWCLGPERLNRLLDAGVRVVGLELLPEPPADVRTVGIDFRSGMRDVLAHLTSLGHTQIGYLWDQQDRPTAPESRFLCFREATAEHGLSLKDDWVANVKGEHRPEIGQAAALALLRRAPELTAIVCHNDLLALGALRAAKQSDMPAPDGVSIVGVDDIFTAQYSDPPLTTLALPRTEAGSMALRWLLQEDAVSRLRPHISTRLIVRSSTGPARS